MADRIEVRLELDTRVLDQILAAAPAKQEAALDKIADDIGTMAITSMAGSKHGRVYYHGDVAHQASAPGEPPAVDTEKLKGSWIVVRRKGERIFGFGAEYAPHLEFGTIRMAARPFFLPAILKGSSGLVKAAAAIAGDQTVLERVTR